MQKITLLGLGAMGQALARSQLDAGYDVTVWNRSAAKADTLVERGAHLSDSPADAIAASEVVMICLSDYASSYAILDQPGVAELIEGRVVIQLSTGTPVDAREMSQWIGALGGHYIDGAIMVYPPTIGSAASQLLIAGESETVAKVQHFLDALGGDIRNLGDEIGAAAALDMAVVSRLLAITPAVVHGALICEAEGVPLQQFASMFPEGDRARAVVLSIAADEFVDNVSASVDVAVGVASSIKRQASTMNINSEFPDFVIGLYQRAVAAGQRDHDTSSLIKVLRN